MSFEIGEQDPVGYSYVFETIHREDTDGSCFLDVVSHSVSGRKQVSRDICVYPVRSDVLLIKITKDFSVSDLC